MEQGDLLLTQLMDDAMESSIGTIDSTDLGSEDGAVENGDLDPFGPISSDEFIRPLAVVKSLGSLRDHHTINTCLGQGRGPIMEAQMSSEIWVKAPQHQEPIACTQNGMREAPKRSIEMDCSSHDNDSDVESFYDNNASDVPVTVDNIPAAIEISEAMEMLSMNMQGNAQLHDNTCDNLSPQLFHTSQAQVKGEVHQQHQHHHQHMQLGTPELGNIHATDGGYDVLASFQNTSHHTSEYATGTSGGMPHGAAPAMFHDPQPHGIKAESKSKQQGFSSSHPVHQSKTDKFRAFHRTGRHHPPRRGVRRSQSSEMLKSLKANSSNQAKPTASSHSRSASKARQRSHSLDGMRGLRAPSANPFSQMQWPPPEDIMVELEDAAPIRSNNLNEEQAMAFRLLHAKPRRSRSTEGLRIRASSSRSRNATLSTLIPSSAESMSQSSHGERDHPRRLLTRTRSLEGIRRLRQVASNLSSQSNHDSTTSAGRAMLLGTLSAQSSAARVSGSVSPLQRMSAAADQGPADGRLETSGVNLSKVSASKLALLANSKPLPATQKPTSIRRQFGP